MRPIRIKRQLVTNVTDGAGAYPEKYFLSAGKLRNHFGVEYSVSYQPFLQKNIAVYSEPGTSHNARTLVKYAKDIISSTESFNIDLMFTLIGN